MAETCDDGDMGTTALCLPPARAGLAGAGRALDRDGDTLERGRGGAAPGADVGG